VLSYTTYVILTAGTTFSRFGVMPLNSPLHPSPFTVFTHTSTIPVYVGGWIAVPWLCKRVRSKLSG
jgi:hypothetical protein